jgi:uncharacterized protein
MTDQVIVDKYLAYLDQRKFPCIAAKAALKNGHLKTFVAEHMACPKDDARILHFLYDFVDAYRLSAKPFHSAAILFRGPTGVDPVLFDALLWERLSALRLLDSQHYSYDPRVSDDPVSENFSFSLKEEAFFVIGIHPQSHRLSRQFSHPALVFNPHAEFEKLRVSHRYEPLKRTIRKRDVQFSGSVNPMLKDFGEESEALQYSGNQYDSQWKCPLTIYPRKDEHHSGT